MIQLLNRSYDSRVVANSPRILIADDESQLLRVLVRVLEKQGYTVISALDGKAALETLRKTPEAIDAIVIDAAIDPEGAGPVLEVLAAEQPQIGVVVTSGDRTRSRSARGALATGRPHAKRDSRWVHAGVGPIALRQR
jgi:DNA-binding NtrC family response regulator